ncbi:MAG: GNAT family N-acetyltransferase [Planctomycetota bacterium]
MTPRHDPDTRRFVLELPGGDPAVVDYAPFDDGTVAFTRVYVPPAHRGTDASRRVVAAAFDHARNAGWRVRPVCPYLADRYVPRHPEIHDLLAETPPAG